ncbi:MAG: hypothetical protein ACPGQL_10790 [Thermoplasmatota archaeon]
MKSLALLLLLCLAMAPSAAADEGPDGEGGEGSGEEPGSRLPALALFAYRTAEWLYLDTNEEVGTTYRDSTGEECQPAEADPFTPRVYLGNPVLGILYLHPDCTPDLP